MKGADSYCGQTKGGSLKVDILPGMPYLDMNIPLPSSTISAECSLIFSADNYIQRGLVYEFLV